MEKELRVGQCRDALAQLHTKLAAQTHILKYKYVHVHHQAQNTCSHNLLNCINAKINTVVAKYRRTFTVLQTLNTHDKSGWHLEFQELWKQDVCNLSQAELPNAPTQERMNELYARTLLTGVMPEGNQMVSWIWRGFLKGNSDDQDGEDEYNEGWSMLSYSVYPLLTATQTEFCLEWSKAHARQAQWNKEVLLLREEMRHVLEFLKWKSDDWLQKSGSQVISSLTTCPLQLKGLSAYACWQAGVFDNICSHFLGTWKGLEPPREHVTEPFYPANHTLDAMELDGDWA